MSKTPRLWGAADLVRNPPEQRDSWIKPAILPRGGLLIMGGEKKIGKSVLLVDLVDRLSRGEPAFGYFETVQARVLYVEREIGLAGIAKRLTNKTEAAGREFHENFRLFSREPAVDPTNPIGREIIAEQIQKEKIDVLCFDPIGRWLLDDSNGSLVGELFNSLEELQVAFPDLGIILVHHFRKPPGDPTNYDSLSSYNFRGSARWVDAPDTIITAGCRQRSMSPGERWRLRTRWETRHQEEPGDEHAEIKFAILDDWSVTPIIKAEGKPTSILDRLKAKEEK